MSANFQRSHSLKIQELRKTSLREYPYNGNMPVNISEIQECTNIAEDSQDASFNVEVMSKLFGMGAADE